MYEYEHARSRLTGFALTTLAVFYESTRSRYVLFLKIFIRETRLRLSCCSYQPFIHSKEHVQLKQTSLLESRCLARKVWKVGPTLTELRLRSELARIHLPRLEETEIFSPTSERKTRVFVRAQEQNGSYLTMWGAIVRSLKRKLASSADKERSDSVVKYPR